MEKDFAQILKSSREIMNHGNDFKKSKPKSNSNLNEGKELPDLTGDYINKIKHSVNGITPEDEFQLNEAMLKTSKLPDSIKKAFMPDLEQRKKEELLEQQYKKQLTQPQNNINTQQESTSINREEIRELVKEEMTIFLSKYFSKALTEQVKSQIKKQMLNEKRGK